jgi:formylglycine-generating enzyme required for sulfatase activity
VGLQHAHEQGLVHRDIKPANLLRANKSGVVKVLDMGIARLSRASADVLTQEGSIMGSLDYIAPEQAMDSSKVDIRADLYSLGCTFYHLLTGQVPFPGGEALAKLTKHQMDEPVPVEQLRPDVPAAVVAIVRKLMAKKSDDRYQTPAELASALENCNLQGAADATLSTHERWAQVVDPGNTAAYRPTKRQRWPLLAGLVVLGALLVGGILLWWQLSPGRNSDGKGSTNGAVSGSNSDALPARYKNSLGIEFVLVPKGKFLMGGGDGEPGTREVEIKHDFYLGQNEVTQWVWMQVMKNNPSKFKNPPAAKPLSKEEQAKLTVDQLRQLKEKAQRDKQHYWKSHPVENVSWDDCQEFIKRLNEMEQPVGWVYSLPSEAEWEYACRGGGDRPVLEYGFDYYLEQPTNMLLPEMANFKDSGKNRTCQVGSYKPNRLGLYDMHGNVVEWCRDEVPGDPNDPKAASQRVRRGGSWYIASGHCRAAYRYTSPPSYRYYYLGLRLARVPVTTPALANAP